MTISVFMHDSFSLDWKRDEAELWGGDVETAELERWKMGGVAKDTS